MFSKKLKRRFLVIAPLIFLLLIWLFNAKATYKKIESPDGEHYAVVSFRVYESFIPMGIGQGSDKKGSIEMHAKDGKSLGSFKLPMLQMAYDLEWRDEGAEIPFVGAWRFEGVSEKRNESGDFIPLCLNNSEKLYNAP